MSNGIVIVGMACRYPDARSPSELWENVLAQRRAFRRLPDQRLRLADFLSDDRKEADRTYSSTAAVISDYEFDRLRFKVAGNTFRATDLAHWLALDVAGQALDDAGFASAEGLPRETAGVFVGNTLTGEFSRANTLRLRWPYVRRSVEASLVNEGWSNEKCDAFLKRVETTYKSPFPPIGEESLAGGLSNTIAGRICNHFDLKGGGYTVDGACASSLVAVAHACSSLVAGDLDVALAGGVDLSLDPFELVGFAKAGALAREEMRVYDRRSEGFWPGEGCGFVVLMRYEDALAQRLSIRALIKGWGISSDGSGGITRPEVDGQLLALKRAYARAGFDIGTVSYFEGHGTGTPVGDQVELQALSVACNQAGTRKVPAAIGSIKANIGHTKAAAGAAGLIKATMALNAGIIPPTTGCEEPHPELTVESPALRSLRTAEPWPENHALRAGVSSMGFGGINAHIVLAADRTETALRLSAGERALSSSFQDAELFLFAGRNDDDLQQQISHVSRFAAKLSLSELSDLAAHLATSVTHQAVRAAVVASRPSDLAARLEQLNTLIKNENSGLNPRVDIFWAREPVGSRVGFLFPGQGTPIHRSGGAWCRRFDFVRDLYARAQLDNHENETSTLTAQPAIVTASLAALHLLKTLNINAEIAVGHSLGELTAFHWAEAIDEETLLRIAKFRGRAMSERGAPSGAMASISASAEESLNLLNGEGVCIAGINSPTQTIISGEAKAVIEVMLRAQQKNLQTFRLPVSHAFHSKLVAAAAPALQTQLEVEKFGSLRRTIVSTVTGECISPNANLRGLLTQQITSPVRFLEAVTDASKEIDLWLEVGPGQVLAGIMSEITKTPVVSLEAGGESLRGLLSATAAAFVLGQPVNYRALFDGRFTRPFSLDWNPKFFVNPCELAPIPQESERSTVIEAEEISVEIETNSEAETISGSPNGSVLELVSELVAQRVELPVSAINAESHVLNDLHLNSISVSQLVAESARRLQLPRPSSPSDFATATIGEIAHALEEQLSLGGRSLSEEPDSLPTGVDSWVRQFRVELVERPLRPQPAAREVGVWHVLSRTESPLVKTLRREFAGSPGNGVVVCLPNEADETIIGDLLAAARLVLPKKEGTTFLLVQQLHGASAFARTLHLEAPHVTTCIVNVPPAHPQAAGWVLAEAMAAEQHTEVYYDENGRRRQPFLRSLSLFEESASLPLSADDVLLVTGGGKGITAECALALAKESGARLALIGRSHANSDDELSNNLKRMTAAGIGFRYVAADVTDAAQISAAVEEIEKELGPVTGFLHGAATNTPRIISALDEALMRQTVDVKVQGARNVLAVINPEKLRLFVTFSSIIARSGLPGEAHYGLANEWLSALTEDWQTEHPSCRCLALEWSLWSDVGMGQRIQRSDLLAQHGITPISPDQGIKTLLQLLAQPLLNGPCVVTGRFREMPTLKLERPELPLQRFLEQPQLYFPNVELIVDVDLATSTDPYLDDHQLNGERLLPAVIGLEAMAQVAMALTIVTELPVFENVKFNSPIVVPEAGQRRIRLAALVTAPGVVKVAVRSDETAFQLDHFVGTCRFGKPNLCEVMLQSQLPAKDSASAIALKPEHDLYGDVLFHRGRFQRLSNYRILKSRECFAEIAADGKTNWFGSYLPKDLVLGDPGVHDAAMHAIQACIPAATLLPTGVERLSLRGTALSGPSFVRARERSNDGNIFVYDVSVADAAGHIVERWDGLSLTAIEAKRNGRSWIEPILAPYLERRFRELVPGTDISVAVIHDEGGDHLARSNKAIRMLVDAESEIFRRSDGKPEVAAECSVSAAHCGGVTMAVAGFGPVGCDVESAVNRPSCVWRTLLGDERIALVQFVEQRANENPCASAARIWAAGECLKKAGAMPRAPLTFLGAHSDGWVVFSSGLFNIATFAAQIRGEAAKVVVAILAQRQ